jgi:hypothetical protein
MVVTQRRRQLGRRHRRPQVGHVSGSRRKPGSSLRVLA